MADHKIAVTSLDGIWLHGTVDDYAFYAKVCDEASGFGIDCGRVIKLHVEKRNGKKHPKRSLRMSVAGISIPKAKTKASLVHWFAFASHCLVKRFGEAPSKRKFIGF